MSVRQSGAGWVRESRLGGVLSCLVIQADGPVILSRRWFEGVVSSFKPITSRYACTFDDGDEEEMTAEQLAHVVAHHPCSRARDRVIGVKRWWRLAVVRRGGVGGPSTVGLARACLVAAGR